MDSASENEFEIEVNPSLGRADPQGVRDIASMKVYRNKRVAKHRCCLRLGF